MSPDRREPERRERGSSRLPECLNPLQRAFFTDVFQGNYRPPTREQIAASVAQQLAYAPLVPLTPVEEAHLHSDAIERETSIYESDRFPLLAGETYFHRTENEDPALRTPTFIVGQDARLLAAPYGLQPLTPSEKERYLTDISVYEKANIQTQQGSSPVYTYGTRHLTAEQQPYFGTPYFVNDHYGYTNGEFTNLLASVRQAQGKTTHDKLRGLDVGGNYGKGAHEAEILDPHLDMTNITVTPEMAFFPLRGGTQLVPAERLPASFAGKFDLIISNFAFPYMRYPDLALENALQALSVGGIMSVEFEQGRNRLAKAHEAENIKRVDDQFKRLEKLAEEGKVKYLPLWRPDFRDARKKWKENSSEVYGQVFLQKIA